METIDFLRERGLRPWRIPLIAAGAAAAISLVFLIADPQEHRATTSVPIGAPISEAPTPNVINQAVENFRGALTSTSVAVEASAATGVPAERIRSSINSSRIRVSSVVEVSFTADDPQMAQEVLITAIGAAVELSQAPDLNRTESQIVAASELIAEAEQRLAVFRQESGFASPESDFEAVAIEIAHLRIQADEAASAGDQAGADEANDSADQLEESFIGLVSEFQQASTARTVASTQLESAIARELTLRSSVDGPIAGVRASPILLERLPKLPSVLGGAIVAAVAAFLLVTLLMVGAMMIFSAADRQLPHLLVGRGAEDREARGIGPDDIWAEDPEVRGVGRDEI